MLLLGVGEGQLEQLFLFCLTVLKLGTGLSALAEMGFCSNGKPVTGQLPQPPSRSRWVSVPLNCLFLLLFSFVTLKM